MVRFTNTDALSSDSTTNPVEGMGRSGQEEYVQRQLPGTKSIKIPNSSVGLVIGKQGATIKSLEQQSGAKISIGNCTLCNSSPCHCMDSTRTITMTGPPNALAQAEDLIFGKVHHVVHSQIFPPLLPICFPPSCVCRSLPIFFVTSDRTPVGASLMTTARFNLQHHYELSDVANMN